MNFWRLYYIFARWVVQKVLCVSEFSGSALNVQVRTSATAIFQTSTRTNRASFARKTSFGVRWSTPHSSQNLQPEYAIPAKYRSNTRASMYKGHWFCCLWLMIWFEGIQMAARRPDPACDGVWNGQWRYWNNKWIFSDAFNILKNCLVFNVRGFYYSWTIHEFLKVPGHWATVIKNIGHSWNLIDLVDTIWYWLSSQLSEEGGGNTT